MSGDNDFGDFAATKEGFAPLGGVPASGARPFTKWYRLDERYTLDDFRNEGVILIFLIGIFVVHIIGNRMNRARARAWITSHAAHLASEFALVGFGAVPAVPAPAAEKEDGLLQDAAIQQLVSDPNKLMREKSLFEFATYATGRQNVAFLDGKLTLKKRFNPAQLAIEAGLALMWDTWPAPEDAAEFTIYPFDGQEAQLVPAALPGSTAASGKTAFDGFVWAVVNKEKMRQLRDERYDLSITVTKDNAKLPPWLVTMSENNEITETLLSPELVKAVTEAGDLIDYMIVTDQPTDKPMTIEETKPRKRVELKYRLPTSDKEQAGIQSLFTAFLQLPDLLVTSARFRPEIMRKVAATREAHIKQIQRAAENEQAEERALEREKAKREKRAKELAGLDAKQQKKYLEKEADKERKRDQKRGIVRG